MMPALPRALTVLSSPAAQTLARRAVMALGACCLAGCFSDSTDSAGNTPAEDGSTTAAVIASAVKQSIQVTAGGPQAAAPGVPITLSGLVTVAGETETVDRLTIIGRALQAYYQANGSYPPAALQNSAGQPTLSWRVLLLPYFGQQALYNKFDLTKPWNDPANAPLLAQMPNVYLGSRAAANSTETGIAGVSGSGGLFQKSAAKLGGGVVMGTIPHGPTMTLAAAPVGAGVHIPWTQPGDVDIGALTRLGLSTGLSGSGSALTPLLFLDGAVRIVPNSTASTVLLGWANLLAEGCTRPADFDVGLRAAWDLDGSGAFATSGRNVSFVQSRAGTYNVAFRVSDAFGNTYNSTTTVEVQ
jgi:hypothetical protein